MERQRAAARQLQDEPPGASAAAGAAVAGAALPEHRGAVALACPGGARIDFVAFVAASSPAVSSNSGSGSGADGGASGGAAAAAADAGTLWVAAGARVHFFAAGAARPKAEVALPPKCAVTALAAPPSTSGSAGATVWTGHADGSARAHHRGAWAAATAAGACRAPIRCAAIDARGQAWFGDDTGQVKVLRFDPVMRAAAVVWQALPDSGGGASAMGAATAMLARGAHVISAGGRAPGALTVWDTRRFAAVGGGDAAGHGAVCCLAALPWDDAGGGGGGSGAGGDGGGAWRLLSGQSNGQLLLWEMEGTRLRVVSALGAPTGSAVRGIATFPAQGILVAAHADGLLRVFPLPSPANGADGCGSGDGDGDGNCDAAGGGVDASCPRVGGDVRVWAPRVAVVRAHKGGLLGVAAMVGATSPPRDPYV